MMYAKTSQGMEILLSTRKFFGNTRKQIQNKPAEASSGEGGDHKEAALNAWKRTTC